MITAFSFRFYNLIFPQSSGALRSFRTCTLRGHISLLLSLILPQIFYLVWNKQFLIAA